MSKHVVSIGMYTWVFLGLLFATFATVEIAFVNLGYLSLYVALAIATAKAMAVIFIFMHVWYQPKLTWVFAYAGFLWLVILLAFTLSDFVTRDWIPFPRGWSG